MLDQPIPIKNVFDKISKSQAEGKGSIQFGSIQIKVNKKLKLFHKKGIICDVCGISGLHFIFKKQKHTFDLSLELIATDNNGKNKRYMTMDHTIPQCINGKSTYENLTPMCNKCNSNWKSDFDKILKSKVIGISEDNQHYLEIIGE